MARQMAERRRAGVVGRSPGRAARGSAVAQARGPGRGGCGRRGDFRRSPPRYRV